MKMFRTFLRADEIDRLGTRMEGAAKEAKALRVEHDKAVAALRDQNLNEHAMTRESRKLEAAFVDKLRDTLATVEQSSAALKAAERWWTPENLRRRAVHNEDAARVGAHVTRLSRVYTAALVKEAELAAALGNSTLAQLIADEINGRPEATGEQRRNVMEHVESIPLEHLDDARAVFRMGVELRAQVLACMPGDRGVVNALAAGYAALAAGRGEQRPE